MNPAEVIIYKPESTEAFKRIAQEALGYALLSFPFTVNRMGLRGLAQRITNIAKGKLAEGLLEAFSKKHGLDMDFKAGETPFWMRDAFDFRWKGLDWDLKNNFVYHKDETLHLSEYLKLPALVPNRFEGDQWMLADEAKKAFLFSFIRQSDKRGGASFLHLDFSPNSLGFLHDLSEMYAGQFPDRAPYSEDWFWGNLEAAGGPPVISIKEVPNLVITGICKQIDRQRFMDTDGCSNHGYVRYLGGWYQPDDKGVIRFNNGTLTTKITNATCPVGFLDAFSGLI